MQMFNDRVAIKRIERTKSESGIILPDVNANADIHMGEIVAIGLIDRKESRDLKIGDKVMYMHHNLNPKYKDCEIIPFREIILKDNSIENADKKRSRNSK